MAFAPIIYSTTPFPATSEHRFTFAYDKLTIFSLTARIINSQSGAIVHEETVIKEDRTDFSYTLRAGILTNGNSYSLEIKITDADTGEESAYSRAILFKCLAEPVITFVDFPATVTNSQFTAEFTYSQRQGELLNSFQFVLLDGQQVVDKSDVIYNTSDLKYSFIGLRDKTEYVCKLITTTISGMTTETTTTFSTNFQKPSFSGIITAENNCVEGTIKLTTNIVSVSGEYDGTPIYITGGGVDLTNGSPVIYSRGFTVADSFALQIKRSNFVAGEKLIELDGGRVVLKIARGHPDTEYSNKVWFCLIVDNQQLNSLFKYTIKSGYYDPADELIISISKNNGLYSLDII